MITRRTALAMPALLAATPALAQWQPDHALTMIVAYAAGGGTDVAARTIARFMERELGQPIVVQNRAGAGGEIGFTELARSRPDGYTIGFVNTPSIVTLPIERRPRFTLNDFQLIANIVDDPGGLWVRSDSDIMDFAGLIAAARQRPGQLGYGTTGVGSDDHLAVLALERATGAQFLHVPFGGSAQVKQNLVSRAIPIASMNMAEGLTEMSQGLLRPLAQMGNTRWSEAPTVPTLKELGFDVVEGSMRGMAAPAGIPPEALTRISAALRATVDNPEFQRIARQQFLPLRFLGPDDFRKELEKLRDGYQALWNLHPWRE
ncbi:tripartite tricarboxylate transporter substrate binding protein [Rhodovarius crocodyli]|uniref:Tripartite tricarboxylate transporter substrate binding protein n=1 Tax=Rhodovarius crocodyli TaxID=1979269 RepID=A0A437MEF0_9PROT|nr:tripartite tricarboxylate transporter substrate binding protein [Rhodovarius crocodyli]RVT96024.1 tripartite tricarboxylate transporter substrate binding protein [Rhodovarius crocodyli]